MTKPFLQQRDGYSCVPSLMRRSCDFMKPEPEGWGPIWTNNMTPEQYVVQLQLHCCSTNRKVTKEYSRFQQSKEMLHQAALSYNQSIATKLDNDLKIWKSANQNVCLPEEWQIEGLLDKFSDYHSTIRHPSSELGSATMSINVLTQKPPERERNIYTNKRKFEMRPIQCDCCQCGGHQIGDQVCRIGAQVHHIQAYKEKHPEEFKQNAMRYEAMNRPKVIKKVCADNLLISSVDEFQNDSEDRYVSLMNDYNCEE